VNQATAAAGINDANTCVVALAQSAGSVASITFNTTVLFPSPNVSLDLGPLSNPRVLAGGVLTLAVTNGVAANPGPFLVEVDYL
jgi:hypothetical protein